MKKLLAEWSDASMRIGSWSDQHADKCDLINNFSLMTASIEMTKGGHATWMVLIGHTC